MIPVCGTICVTAGALPPGTLILLPAYTPILDVYSGRGRGLCGACAALAAMTCYRYIKIVFISVSGNTHIIGFITLLYKYIYMYTKAWLLGATWHPLPSCADVSHNSNQSCHFIFYVFDCIEFYCTNGET